MTLKTLALSFGVHLQIKICCTVLYCTLLYLYVWCLVFTWVVLHCIVLYCIELFCAADGSSNQWALPEFHFIISSYRNLPAFANYLAIYLKIHHAHCPAMAIMFVSIHFNHWLENRCLNNDKVLTLFPPQTSPQHNKRRKTAQKMMRKMAKKN